jgi:multimeric flavodoxin WrbA
MLSTMQVRGCQGCGACKNGLEDCAVSDDGATVLAAMREADVLVLASPIYFGEITGQLKCFFDRTYSLLNPDFTSRLTPGRKAVYVLTQGDPDLSHYTDVFERYRTWTRSYGFGQDWVIRGESLGASGDVLNRTDLLAKADEIAKAVFG